MGRELRGKRVLITGASSGIGRCLAEQVALQGAKVALAARSTEKLAELASSLTTRGAEVVAVPADITLQADRARMIEVMGERFNGMDVLINNAGVGSWGHFSSSSEEVLRRVMEVNFFAPAELIRASLPLLQRGCQPAIVNVASMCGRAGMPAWTEYSASKFALVGLTEALRGELARFEIDILLILPGLTRSELPRALLRNEGRMKIDFDKGMPCEKVAADILYSLQKNYTETVLGRDARWMLRVRRFFPWFVDRMLARRVRQLYAE